MDNQNMNFNGSQDQGGAGFSIASMVLGILSLVLCCIPYLPTVLGIIGIVLAVISLRKQAPGKGMAIAGLVCSLITVALFLIGLIFGAAITSALMDSLDLNSFR